MQMIKIVSILLNFPLLGMMTSDRLPLTEQQVHVFEQPLTQGSYNFTADGFIPAEPLTRIRKIHKEMMYSIQSIFDQTKQVKYLLTLCNTANDDLKKLRQKLDSSGLRNYADFDKVALKADAFILLVSHAALVGNSILYFPDILAGILKKNKEFDLNVKWVLELASSSNIINDKHLLKLFHLVKQEMGLVEKEPDYENPYKRKKIVPDSPKTTTKKPRKKLQRGPRLSGGGGGEL